MHEQADWKRYHTSVSASKVQQQQQQQNMHVGTRVRREEETKPIDDWVDVTTWHGIYDWWHAATWKLKVP